MTQTTHTPGPWRITTDFIGVYDSEARRIANLDSDGAPDFGEDETLANARLIAAAPDMLAALIDARALLCEILDGVDKDAYPVFAATTAAIAKAKGE